MTSHQPARLDVRAPEKSEIKCPRAKDELVNETMMAKFAYDMGKKYRLTKTVR